jgi:hypothetical protein
MKKRKQQSLKEWIEEINRYPVRQMVYEVHPKRGTQLFVDGKPVPKLFAHQIFLAIQSSWVLGDL